MTIGPNELAHLSGFRPLRPAKGEPLDRTTAIVWTQVDRWIASADRFEPSWYGIADWRAEAHGRGTVEETWREGRRSTVMVDLTAPPLLQRIRTAVRGPVVVLKGPEISALYPAAGLRPYGDLDLLLPDVALAETALLAAGFVQTGIPGRDDLPGHFHGVPLRYPGLPLAIELHYAPGWLAWMTPPSNDELFARAVPSATGVEGVLTLPPVEHTLFLAVHSWRHGPFHSLLHLIDIELMRQRCEPAALETTARAWGMARVWEHTLRMIDWCFYDPNRPLSPLERLWSRHLRQMRPRSLRELYLATRTKALAADTPQDIADGLLADAAWTIRLRPGESYRSVARYAVRGLRSSGTPAATRARRH